ncbi:MAG: hypothetical protein QG577_1301 [Thermodesulfobacteriota bacterium]|nr:hypothetical protein [Thermodesulfobacteriota bacterium]
MGHTLKRSTIYFQPEIHKALRLKAVSTLRSMSEIVNDAVRQALKEDQEDLAAFDERSSEPVMSYEELLNNLKANGRL